MNYSWACFLILLFSFGHLNTAEGQIFKRKKTEQAEAPKEKKKGLLDGLLNKKNSAKEKPEKEKVVLRKSHKAAKADVRASKKERKAAEAREEAARARAAVIKAKRKEEKVNRKVVRKEGRAQKSRKKAEEKKSKPSG